MSNNVSSEARVVQRGEAFGVSVRRVSSVYPSPEVVESFEKHYQGAAKEILEMAKAEQAHLHRLDRESSLRMTLGMLAGVILCALFILTGTFLVYTNHPVGGATSILLGLLMIVAISKPTPSVGAAFHRRPQCWENDSFFASFPCGRRWNAVPTIGF